MAIKLLFFFNTKVIRKLCQRRVGTYNSKLKYSTAQKTHYDALDVSPYATYNEIKSAFYKLSLQYHPDKDSSTGAKERFQEISMAYEVLSNHESRQQYDRRMRIVQNPAADTTKRQLRRNEYHFATKSPVGGKIYDFDEWTRFHYTKTFDRQRKFTEKYHDSRQTKYKEYRLPVRELPMKMYFLYIFGVAMFVMTLNYIYFINDEAIALKVLVKEPKKTLPEKTNS